MVQAAAVAAVMEPARPGAGQALAAGRRRPALVRCFRRIAALQPR